jgi:hypothetical protein
MKMNKFRLAAIGLAALSMFAFAGCDLLFPPENKGPAALEGNLVPKTRLWVNTNGDSVFTENVIDGTVVQVREGRVALSETLGNGMARIRATLELTDAGWAGLVLRRSNVTDPLGWHGQGYLILFYPSGNVGLKKLTPEAILDVVDLGSNPPNLALDGSTEYLIEYGTQASTEGVRIVLKIDGVKWIDVVDEAAPLSGNGYFAAAINGGTPANNAFTISSMEWKAFDATGADPEVPEPPADPDLTADATLWNIPTGTTSTIADGTMNILSDAPLTLKAADGDMVYTVTGIINFDQVTSSPVIVRLRRAQYAATDVWWHYVGYCLKLHSTGWIELFQFNPEATVGLRSGGEAVWGGFSNGIEYEFEFGVITEATGVRLTMKVDGDLMLNYLDTSDTRISGTGHLAFAQETAGVNSFVIDSVLKAAPAAPAAD